MAHMLKKHDQLQNGDGLKLKRVEFGNGAIMDEMKRFNSGIVLYSII